MRQNIGLVFLTLGSFLLSMSIFRVHLIKFIHFFKWKNIPWESRLALWFCGIKNENDYMEWFKKAQEKYPFGKELKDLTIKERFYLNMPFYAFLLMFIGLLLCFNYSALCKFLGIS